MLKITLGPAAPPGHVRAGFRAAGWTNGRAVWIKGLAVSGLVGALLGSGAPARAQDAQFSQFYAAPLYLNPAFAGSALAPRIGFNYRNQWPGLNATFVTYSAYADTYFARAKSGVGLLITHDVQGFGGFRNTDIGGQYAYQLELSSKWAFRAGLQASYVLRGVNYFDLTFGDQFTSQGFTGTPSLDGQPENRGYLNLATGGVLYSEKFYFGAAVHNLNRPNQSFFANQVSPLPMRGTFTAGMKIDLSNKTRRGLHKSKNDREVSLSPALLYKTQGRFQQLDVGMYYTFEPLVLGVWYRGLPIVRSAEGLNNHDAAIVLVGFRNNNFSIGYSYDLTISSLTPATGGAHELSVSYVFPQNPKAPKKKGRRLPCPKF